MFIHSHVKKLCRNYVVPTYIAIKNFQNSLTSNHETKRLASMNIKAGILKKAITSNLSSHNPFNRLSCLDRLHECTTAKSHVITLYWQSCTQNADIHVSDQIFQLHKSFYLFPRLLTLMTRIERIYVRVYDAVKVYAYQFFCMHRRMKRKYVIWLMYIIKYCKKRCCTTQ